MGLSGPSSHRLIVGNLSQHRKQLFVLRNLVQRIYLAENDTPIFIDNEYRSLVDTRDGWSVPKNSVAARDLPVRVEIATQRKRHHANVFLLPGNVTRCGIGAYAQNLGIKTGELG